MKLAKAIGFLARQPGIGPLEKWLSPGLFCKKGTASAFLATP